MTVASALVAFGHFMAFFALASALTLQVALVKPSPDLETAKRIQRSDRVYGISAVLVLVLVSCVCVILKRERNSISTISFC